MRLCRVRVVLHYAVVLDRLLDSYILLHHLPPSPLPSLCCVRSLPFSVDLESALRPPLLLVDIKESIYILESTCSVVSVNSSQSLKNGANAMCIRCCSHFVDAALLRMSNLWSFLKRFLYSTRFLFSQGHRTFLLMILLAFRHLH